MIDTLHIDDLDGAVTLFKATEEGTETIAVFDEEHREVIQDLLAEVKRLQDALKEAVEVVKEMESMAYADADADKFANHALEFIGNVKEMI